MSTSTVKIAILCLPGLQSFLKNIIGHFNQKYELRTCFSGNAQELADSVKWADIVWLEWANELTVALSNNPTLLNGKHVICRLHSYEAFVDDFCKKIEWSKVNTIVFVAKHIADIVKARVDGLDRQVERIAVIPNGIDINAYPFQHRTKGHHLAYVGYINYKKGPMLLLHAFRELVQADNRYRLHVAGKIQDLRYEYYFKQMIDEMNLQNNIRFDGWIDDIGGWLQDKHYIISSSVLESQGMGIMEAMACGIKPVIHNFVGAKTIYPESYLWNTIPEFVEHIQNDDYDSVGYRQVIQDRYNVVGQMQKIDAMIEDITKEKGSLEITTGLVGPEKKQPMSEPELPAPEGENQLGLHPQIKTTLDRSIRPGMQVLEVGCKNGQIAWYVAGLGASVVAVDTSAEWIARAREESSHPNISYQVVDYSSLDLKEKFDMIILIQELEYMPRHNVEAFLATIIGHASPRAVIYVDIRDGRFIQHQKINQPTSLIQKCESYTPDAVLAMFSKFGYQPYHINIYGGETPVQFNEYLFAAEALFETTYQNQ